jgi:hypothetical protein
VNVTSKDVLRIVKEHIIYQFGIPIFLALIKFFGALRKKMEDSDQDIQKIDPPVLNRIKRKKYHQRMLKDPLDPYFCRCSKRNKDNQQTIDVEDVNTPTVSDSVTNSTTEDVGIR